jgi:hypothetical protein
VQDLVDIALVEQVPGLAGNALRLQAPDGLGARRSLCEAFKHLGARQRDNWCGTQKTFDPIIKDAHAQAMTDQPITSLQHASGPPCHDNNPPSVLSLTYSAVAGESGLNSAHQFMSSLGATLQTAEIYTSQAEQALMAVAGMKRLEWSEK